MFCYYMCFLRCTVKKVIKKRSLNLVSSFISADFSRCFSEPANEVVTSFQIDEVTKRLYRHPDSGHNVLLVQPRVKSGKEFTRKEVAQMKMDEAAALINTLPGWRVVTKHIQPVTSLRTKLVFGTGHLQKIKEWLRDNRAITAVFIGIDILTSLQSTKLEECLNVPIFDRYQVILQIFHDHAHTNEAKLQLALAEIPYLRIKLCSYSHTRNPSSLVGISHVGGEGETFMELRRRILNERELKLKNALQKIRNQREVLRRSDTRTSTPIIAVVGYTNCGKTTLIKSLTNDERLVPEDKLFATLDVTLHPCRLPSNQRVLLIDTVGFISDVPTQLIQSFQSTLEEILLADLVIHIRDISHPDTEAQKEAVLQTLEQLNLPAKLLESIVEVQNKVDLLDKPPVPSEDDSTLYISAIDGTGLAELAEVVDEKLMENTGHEVTLFRIPNGGAEYVWLLREVTIKDAMADVKDPNFFILETVISPENLAKFKYHFGDFTISVEQLKESL